MGLEIIGIIVSVVSTVISFVTEIFAADEEAEQANKQLEIQAAQRKLQEQREKARLLRESRERRGEAVAGAAGAGTLASSAAAGGIIAIESGVNRETNFINRFGALSSQADEITKQQIASAQNNRIFSAAGSALGGLASGIGSFANSFNATPATIIGGSPPSPVAPVRTPASTALAGI